MSNEPKANLGGGLLAILIVGLIGGVIWFNQRHNQFAPPFPNVPPVVPQIPDILGELAAVKTQCEGRAATVKAMAAEKRRRMTDIDAGRMLYVDVQAEMAECVGFLEAAMVRRFRQEDGAKIANLLSKLDRRRESFVEWTNKVGPPILGAFPSLSDAEKSLGEWMDDCNKKNERIIEQLRIQMQECRLRNWQEL